MLNAARELEDLLKVAEREGNVSPGHARAIADRIDYLAGEASEWTAYRDDAPEYDGETGFYAEELPDENYKTEPRRDAGSEICPAEDQPAEDDEETEAVEPNEPEGVAAEAPVRERSLKSMISINDRYIYLRNLFGGSTADLEASLTIAEHASGLPEAEDYFYNDLQWDAESDDVKAFLSMLERYYRQ